MQNFYVSPSVVGKMSSGEQDMFTQIMLNTPCGFKDGHYIIPTCALSMLSSSGIQLMHKAISNTVGSHRLYYKGPGKKMCIHIFLGNQVGTNIIRLTAIMTNPDMESYSVLDIPSDIDISTFKKETMDQVVAKIREYDETGKYDDVKILILYEKYKLL
jgi:hypothetical protein